MTPLPKTTQTVFRLLRELPPPKENPTAKLLLENDGQHCAFCKHVVSMQEFVVYNSGVVAAALLPLCKACQPTFKDCARIVCCGCRSVAGWVDPHVDPDRFVFQRGASYHIQACPACVSGLKKSDIIEKVIYLNTNYNKFKQRQQ